MIIEQHNTRARVVSASDAETAWLASYLTYSEKSFARSTNGKQTFNNIRKVGLYDVPDESFPAGFIPLVVSKGRQNGLSMSVVDRRRDPPERNADADLAWLRDYQLEAVQAAIDKTRGILSLPTGAGKTEIAIGLMRAVPARWLFLVHRADIAVQSAERLRKRALDHGLSLSVGVFGAGNRDTSGDVMFATFQALASGERKPAVQRLLKSVTGIIVDECHVAPADSYARVINRATNAYYRIGMSGTPLDRSDHRSLLAIGTIGPVIYKVTATQLVDAGVLAQPRVRMVELNQTTLPSGHNYAKLYSAGIAESELRNALIVDIAERAQQPFFVFVKHVNHGKKLVHALRQSGLRVDFAWGAKDTAQRTSMIKRLIDGDLDGIICSVVFQEGIDVPMLRSVINAAGMKSAIATIQRAGRGMRKAEGKDDFEVWDILDKGSPTLERHAKDRRRAYKRQGYELVVEKPSARARHYHQVRAAQAAFALDDSQL